jgi:hypothetical protein
MIRQFFKTVIVFTLLLPLHSCGQSKRVYDAREERKLYDSIARQLVTVGVDDQKYRNKMDEVRSVHGGDSRELKELFKEMARADSINFIKVSSIIDTYGWLGRETIGAEANHTLFMVIQHASLQSQEKYLPVLRIAVKDGKASSGNLALLEDRVALRNGKKQIFGSQVAWNMHTNEYHVLPLEDPDNVDKRRSEVGLGSLAEYLMNCCNLVWDVESYKNKVLSEQLEGKN